MSKDDYLSEFRFVDITKVLPYSDPVCPPDGVCSENLQTLIKLHMTQSTDTTKKPKNFFQLFIPKNYTKGEIESTKELVMKNETSNTGDVYLEGSMKQLKNLLKNNIVVKPSCMYDTSIKVDIKIMYAINGQYNDKNSRSVEFELAQI